MDAFNSGVITKSVLKKIIEYPGVVEEREAGKDGGDPVYLYKHQVSTDAFILILQGRIEVTVGTESLVFEDGPFSVFGVNSLIVEGGQQFAPDYSVKVISNVQYLKVTRSLYRSAIRASKMEKENKTPDNYQEYDEIFWTHLKKTGSGADPDCLEVVSTRSDRSSLRSRGSMRSTEDGGTPSKHGKTSKAGLLAKITPNFERKRRSSPSPAEVALERVKKRNELSSSSQDNPLMKSNESLGPKSASKVSTCSQENPLLSNNDVDAESLTSETQS